MITTDGQLQFKNISDRKVVNASLKKNDNATRKEYTSSLVTQCVFFDHITRRKT